MPKGIVIFGGNGCGKTTLGRKLAKKLGYQHMDIEDYYFLESDIPYSKSRSHEEVRALMLEDIKKYGSFIITAVNGDCGDEINSMYEFAVYMYAPLSIRLERVKKRSFEQFGNRILTDGDLCESEQQFFEFVKNRSPEKTEKFIEALSCPVIKIDAKKPIEENLKLIIKEYQNIKRRRS